MTAIWKNRWEGKKKTIKVLDVGLRAILIAATEFWEKRLNDPTINAGLTSKTITETGITILGEVETFQNTPKNLPSIFTFDFMLDLEKWKECYDSKLWQLKHGHMLFWDHGIRLLIMKPKKSKTDSYLGVSFDIDDGEGGRLPLNLLHEPSKFYLHRDLTYGIEWEVQLEMDFLKPEKQERLGTKWAEEVEQKSQ